MTEPAKNPSPFDLLIDQIRAVVREEIKAALNGNGHAKQLLTPKELAEKLMLTGRKDGEKVCISWVYEQSRQGNIPTHRIGRYIRFDLEEVLESLRKKQSP